MHLLLICWTTDDLQCLGLCFWMQDGLGKICCIGTNYLLRAKHVCILSRSSRLRLRLLAMLFEENRLRGSPIVLMLNGQPHHSCARTSISGDEDGTIPSVLGTPALVCINGSRVGPGPGHRRPITFTRAIAVNRTGIWHECWQPGTVPVFVGSWFTGLQAHEVGWFPEWSAGEDTAIALELQCRRRTGIYLREVQSSSSYVLSESNLQPHDITAV